MRCVVEGRMRSLLEAAGVEVRLVEPLARYGELVLESNRKFNLTGAKSEGELAAHLLDSLTVAPYVVGPYVDVGSGAGLPAVPVAIATGTRVTMIETTRKKAAFLKHAIEMLGIDGEVVAERAE